jgi:hypothetical protein
MLLIVSCAALTILAAIFVLRPLFGKSENSLDILLTAETELDRLMDRKASIFGNLKDLALEHEMGRLSDDDFERLEAGYKADAAAILQKLEQMGASEALEASIEKDIASRKTGLSADESPPPRDDKPLCPSCGAEIIPGKRFCADCGHEL